MKKVLVSSIQLLFFFYVIETNLFGATTVRYPSQSSPDQYRSLLDLVVKIWSQRGFQRG